MAAITIEELVEQIKPGQTVAGIDLGTETIGLAVSDLSLRLASPRPMIKRKKFTLDAIALIAALEKDKAERCGNRPARQHGWQRGTAGSGYAGLCAQYGAENRSSIRVLGRTAVDGRCRARID